MASERILIVDDNPTNQKLMRVLLASHGYEVIAAGNAEEALELLEGRPPRLILMDIQLPGMDGLELTRRLKKDPATAAILVVAVTAYAMKGDAERAQAAGCDGYVTKPIDVETLPDRIRAWLDGRDDAHADVRDPRGDHRRDGVT